MRIFGGAIGETKALESVGVGTRVSPVSPVVTGVVLDVAIGREIWMAMGFFVRAAVFFVPGIRTSFIGLGWDCGFFVIFKADLVS